MWITLHSVFGSLDLWARGSQPRTAAQGRAISFDNAVQARCFLAPFLADSFNRDSIRRFLADQTSVEPWRLDECDLDDPLAELLVQGAVLGQHYVARLPLPLPASEQESEVAAEPAESTTWIEIRVIWDHDGKAAGRLEFDLETPDQQRRKVTANGEGLIRVDGLTRGACRLLADLKDAQVANSARLVGLGDHTRANGAAAKTDAVKHLVEVEQHRVRTGETLASIATGAGMSWNALAKFNFGTDEKEKVRDFLRCQVGAWVEDPAQDPFDDGDEPGILFVPRAFEMRGLATSKEHVLRISPLRAPTLGFVFSA